MRTIFDDWLGLAPILAWIPPLYSRNVVHPESNAAFREWLNLMQHARTIHFPFSRGLYVRTLCVYTVVEHGCPLFSLLKKNVLSLVPVRDFTTDTGPWVLLNESRNTMKGWSIATYMGINDAFLCWFIRHYSEWRHFPTVSFDGIVRCDGIFVYIRISVHADDGCCTQTTYNVTAFCGDYLLDRYYYLSDSTFTAYKW